MIEGEAVLLGVDGVSNFDGLHSRRFDDEVQLYAFDALMLRATICESCRSQCARRTSPGCWRAGRAGIFISEFEQARSGRTCFARPASSTLRACVKAPGQHLPRRPIAKLIKARNRGIMAQTPQAILRA